MVVTLTRGDLYRRRMASAAPLSDGSHQHPQASFSSVAAGGWGWAARRCPREDQRTSVPPGTVLLMTPPSHPSRMILFDADGVLVDSHAGYASVWDRWARYHHLDPVAVLAATHARRPIDTIAEVAPHLDPVLEYARLAEHVDEMPEAFPVFPDAAALLARIPSRQWAVVTSGDATRVRARMTAGALPLPTVLVDWASVQRGKPDPEGYLLAASQLGADPRDCLVVEDAPAGVRAARSAGMQVIALTTSHSPTEMREADHVVSSLTEAQPQLLSWVTGPSQ